MRDTLALQYGILASAVLAGVVAALAFLAALGVFSSASGQDVSSETVTIVAGTPYTEDLTNDLISDLGTDARCVDESPRTKWQGWRSVRIGSIGNSLDHVWYGVRLERSNKRVVGTLDAYDYTIVGTLTVDNGAEPTKLYAHSICTTPAGTDAKRTDDPESFDIAITGNIPGHRAPESKYHGHHHSDGVHPDAALAEEVKALEIRVLAIEEKHCLEASQIWENNECRASDPEDVD